MKKVILVGMLSIGMLSCEAQGQSEVKVQKSNTVDVVTYQLPPQTTISESGKDVKVVTSNLDAQRLLSKHFSHVVTKFSRKTKEDRWGSYEEFTSYFPKNYGIRIIELLQTLVPVKK